MPTMATEWPGERLASSRPWNTVAPAHIKGADSLSPSISRLVHSILGRTYDQREPLQGYAR